MELQNLQYCKFMAPYCWQIILVIFIECPWNQFPQKRARMSSFTLLKPFFWILKVILTFIKAREQQPRNSFLDAIWYWSSYGQYMVLFLFMIEKLTHSNIVIVTTTGVEISDWNNIRSVSSTTSKIWYFCKNS